VKVENALCESEMVGLEKPLGWSRLQNLAEAPFAGDERFRAVVVRFMTMRTFEGADIRVGNKRIRAFAGHTLAPQYRETLQAGFAFYEPDQSHLSANLIDRIFQFAYGA
jgi:hypothetical protein